MNIAQQRAALAKIQPKSKAAKAQADDTSLRDTLVNFLGATPTAVTSFFGDIKTSHQYHKAVRKGELN